MNYGRNAELIERLAAEYALGTLRGAARLRFARLAREDAAVARAVREWEERLAPMASAVPEATPSRRVWRAVQARLAPVDGAAGLRKSLAFWRSLGLAASGCAAALLVAFAIRQPAPSAGNSVEAAGAQMQQSYVATLTDKAGKVVLLAYAERNSDRLWLKRTGMQAIDPATQVFELWGLPSGAGAPPKSLGLIPAADKGAITLAAAADSALGDFPSLAVSLEPAGGSKTGLPTGPVLYSGPCFKFW
jgi:anti-sigma-K factor RskA